MSDPVVKITQTFHVIAELVFDAWLDTSVLEKWMFGPAVRDEEIVHLELDPKVGGKFSFLVRRQGEEIDHVGQYFEIDSPRRLIFTWVSWVRTARQWRLRSPATIMDAN
jgi:uncharacterized protein YndB with AHSA1/START domain